MSSVRNGPPTISPTTVSVPAILTLLLAVTGPVNVEEPFTFNVPKVAVPVTVSSPVTVRSVPLNVKLPLSTNLPLAPAYVIRPLVKSLTCACASVESPLTPNVPVTFEFASNSIEPVPVVLTSKLLLVAVVSIRLPTICISSVRNGPPTISPVTYKVPLTVALSFTVKLLVVTVPVTVSLPAIVSVPVTVGLAENTIFSVPVAPVLVTPSTVT